MKIGRLTRLLLGTVLLSQTSFAAADKTVAAAKAEQQQPVVQLAILLDTSNSMDGLIEQTKGQLWKIVNEFINARQGGKRPEVQVALFEYGKSSLSAASGYIRRIQPLTNDLDKISEELFALKTNGGDEYCGWVIQEAVEKLQWSKSPNDLKVIFIAGNEPFTQGPVDYRKSCKAAIEHGIIVNTIHCGAEQEGVNTKWQDGAFLAEGKYMVINQNQAVVHYEAPQDREIARLGEELNKTYIAYGVNGLASQARQTAQDNNASFYSMQGSAVNRAICKASDNYHNGAWDLVDAIKDSKLDVAKMKKEELPVELQKMKEPERIQYVEQKRVERETIQKQIQELNAGRAKYVAEQMAKSTNGVKTLDTVMITTIREQATKKNYQFGK